MKDELVKKYIEMEQKRQCENIELIASENFVSEDILEACGSILTNKYAEGYPNARYYDGCENVDLIEQLAIDRLKTLFKAEHANVQAHSGSQANMAVYMAILNPGDKVLGMDLNAGGHLTHGHTMNFSGVLYDFYAYGVNKETEMLDYEEIRKLALEIKPKLIVAGASAYSRIIDFKKFGEIADEVGAYLMVDMAHIAGLIATGLHPNPVPYADFVTSTTHKTLRGPRGGIILCKEEYAKKINSRIFPGTQGGPLQHIIAAKAICFQEAMQDEYKEYIKQVVANMQAMAQRFIEKGVRVVSNGTDNHLLMIDVKNKFNITGKEAASLLSKVNITCNKNSIPFDNEKPVYTSGIRLGSAAMTTKGYKEKEFIQIADWICELLEHKEVVVEKIAAEVLNLTKNFKG
ncbi:serine hydroxymethyltransferase [Gemella sp. zg-1178]|uniref:serine hydroxymethyltransferase n=1 Tax=Gemella sp. zg-1178 TaxID=2840372 RepID=UPI001C04194D|nr:serine hydroxymethyltransferase [Gemella sp. zg-1178]MBU0278828.1 serine hydroxymethyltransferase [Gemella sp. zg-1178]